MMDCAQRRDHLNLKHRKKWKPNCASTSSSAIHHFNIPAEYEAYMEALQEQKRIVLAQISGRMGDKAAQPSPPETFGAYAKKSGENPGVIAMIDLLIKDFAKEMTKAENEEKKSQADHDYMRQNQLKREHLTQNP